MPLIIKYFSKQIFQRRGNESPFYGAHYKQEIDNTPILPLKVFLEKLWAGELID